MPEAYFDSRKSAMGVLNEKELDYRTEVLHRLGFYFPTINAELQIFHAGTLEDRRVCTVDGFLGAPSTAKRLNVPQQKVSRIDAIIKEYRGEAVPYRPTIQELMDSAKNQGRDLELDYDADSVYCKLENELFVIFKKVMDGDDKKILRYVKAPTMNDKIKQFKIPRRNTILD